MPPSCTGSDRSAEPRCRFGACRGVRLHAPFRENPGGARRCVPEAQGSPQADGHALGLVAEEQEDGNRPRAARFMTDHDLVRFGAIVLIVVIAVAIIILIFVFT